jgi:hypothetical protein
MLPILRNEFGRNSVQLLPNHHTAAHFLDRLRLPLEEVIYPGLAPGGFESNKNGTPKTTSPAWHMQSDFARQPIRYMCSQKILG